MKKYILAPIDCIFKQFKETLSNCFYILNYIVKGKVIFTLAALLPIMIYLVLN